MSIEHPTPNDLMNAHHANTRHVQIGGLTDGISPEVAADLGYETPEETQQIIRNIGSRQTPAEERPETAWARAGYSDTDKAMPDETARRIGREGIKAVRDILNSQQPPESR